MKFRTGEWRLLKLSGKRLYLPYPTPPYLPNLNWVFNLQPTVPEADALQLEVSWQVNKGA